MRRRWGWIALIVAAAVLVLTGLALARGVAGLLRLSSGGDAREPDPMFAEPAERVTRPPEMAPDETPVAKEGEDPSLHWVYETITPVEKTAEELAAEGQ